MSGVKKVKNILWLFFGKFGIVFFSIFTFIFFALYLTPEQLGKGALVIALIELVSVFFSSMLETPLVRKSVLTAQDKASAFWLGGGSSIFLSILLVVAISYFYSDDTTWMLAAFGSLKFFFSNLSRSYIADLRIQRKFKALTTRTLIGKIIGATSAILFAIAGAGEWSVIIQPVVMEFVSLSILVYVSGTPSIRNCCYQNFLGLLSEGYSFAIKFSCNSLLEKLTVIILSVTTSLESVGYFTFARRLVELPRAALQSAITTYSIPVFSSRIEKGKPVEKLFKDITFFTFIIFSPLFIWYGILFSEVLIPIFGDKWSQSADLFLALSTVASIRLIDLYIPSVLVAYKRSKIGLIKELSNTFLCIVIVWVASTNFGLWGAVIGSATYAILSVIIRYNSISLLLPSFDTFFLNLKYFIVMLVYGSFCIYVNSTYLSSIVTKMLVTISGLLLFILTIHFSNKNLITRGKELFRL